MLDASPAALLGIAAAPFVGSFLGTLVCRLPAGEPVVLARSRCARCGTALRPRDLIPLASWLLSRGRCRWCGTALSAFYPAIELAAVAVALAGALATPDQPPVVTVATLVLGWTLLALAWTDLRHLLLPDALTLPLVPLGLLAVWLVGGSVADAALGAAAGYAGIALIGAAYRALRGRDGIGRGDAKLMAAAGAWLGWAGLPSVLLIGALAGLAAVLVEAARGRPVAPKRRLPFGAALAFAIWVVWLCGPLDFG